MNWPKDLICAAVLLFLEHLEALVLVIIVLFLIRLKFESRQQREKINQQRRQLLYRPRKDGQQQNLQKRYQALQQQQRAAQKQGQQPRRRRRPQPETEHVSQQEATPSSSSEQSNSESALCGNCQKFFRIRRSGPTQRKFPHSDSLTVIHRNAINGCSVCAMISRKLKTQPVAADKPVAFTIEPWSVGWHLWSPHIDIQVIPMPDETSKRIPPPPKDLCG